MTTFQNTIDRTRNLLMTGQQDRINVLNATIDASQTTLVAQHELKSITENSRITIDLEEMHVLSISGSAAGSTITVIRGYNGSTAAAHTVGAIIRVNPQFSDYRIGQEVNDELEDLSSPDNGLYRMRELEFTFNPSTAGYNLNATDLIDVWRVRYDTAGPSSDWPVFRRDDWYVDQHANTTDFAQGIQLVLRKPAYPGFTVRVSYKAKFGGPLTTPADDVGTLTGLHTEAHDILAYGACLTLLAGRDVKRSFMENQPEPRRASEVGTSAGQQAIRPLMARYMDRLNAEVSRLNQRFPEQL